MKGFIILDRNQKYFNYVTRISREKRCKLPFIWLEYNIWLEDKNLYYCCYTYDKELQKIFLIPDPALNVIFKTRNFEIKSGHHLLLSDIGIKLEETLFKDNSEHNVLWAEKSYLENLGILEEVEVNVSQEINEPDLENSKKKQTKTKNDPFSNLQQLPPKVKNPEEIAISNHYLDLLFPTPLPKLTINQNTSAQGSKKKRKIASDEFSLPKKKNKKLELYTSESYPISEKFKFNDEELFLASEMLKIGEKLSPVSEKFGETSSLEQEEHPIEQEEESIASPW